MSARTLSFIGLAMIAVGLPLTVWLYAQPWSKINCIEALATAVAMTIGMLIVATFRFEKYSDGEEYKEINPTIRCGCGNVAKYHVCEECANYHD
jgi:hypothetical protein